MGLFALQALSQIIGTLSAQSTPWHTERWNWDGTVGTDNALHLHSGRELQALNADGSFKWSYTETCENCTIVLHKEGPNGTIHLVSQQDDGEYRGQWNRWFVALNGTDGSVLWTRASQLNKDPRVYCQRCQENCDVNTYNPFHVSERAILHRCEHMGSSSFGVEVIDVGGAWQWVNNEDVIDARDGPDGVLVLGLNDLWSFQRETGLVKWTLKLGYLGGWPRNWATTEDGVFVAQSTSCCETWTPDQPNYKTDLVRLNGEDGSVLWNNSYGLSPMWNGGGAGGPTDPGCQGLMWDVNAISGSNGEVYVNALMDNDGSCKLHAFDADGNTLRTLPCFNYGADFTYGKAIWRNEDGADEDLFIASSDYWTNRFAYSGTTGQLLWNISFSQDQHLSWGMYGTVFLHSYHSNSTVAMRDGKEVWRANDVVDPPYLMASDGTTYLAKGNCEIVAVDAEGTEKWSRQIFAPSLFLDTIVDSALSETSLAMV